ncbi:FAD-dependent oxidoreductase [Oxalobacter vibrioformis]|uniref:FAD-dependent oxidoreductase n=1 Tax=Oxalobacter vibrioformis TaxID=933080 RepID=A0A9E9LZJ0_9BURK|nr:FAD-dependent oxidoreductase [Oxalobacter vibrioformis]WAW10432.1 FAD-dependent oxidoreductase [Oxalobacter vibrioformis]
MKTLRIIVIGGVAAGASFAARARRLSETAQITIIERGPDVSFANCGLPYHIGGEIPERRTLAVQTEASLKAMLNLDVRTLSEATFIDRAAKRVLVRNLRNGEEEWLAYDKLMLSPGAAPVFPSLPGIDDPRVFTLRNLQDMDRIAAASEAGKHAVIAGAGFIGLEMAEQLYRKGLSVEIVQISHQVLSLLDAKLAGLLEDELSKNNIGLHLGNQITRFEGRENKLLCHLSSGTVLETDLVVMSIGVQPESALAQAAGLQLGEKGHIAVSAFMQTSDPDIYAAGDVVETSERTMGGQIAVPLGGPANRQGRVAADHLFLKEKARPYPGSLGTSIVRVFEMAAGVTGWNEKGLKKAGIDYETVTVTDSHHASYYPGAKPLTLKIFWARDDGMLLGAQAAGQEGVDKRLDVMATAIAAGMNIEDLCHLELAYAPPFGSAKDVVNIAGFAATNMQDELVNMVHEFPAASADVQLLDVRGKALSMAQPVPGAINIPLTSLRNSMDRLDPGKPVVIFCSIGKNSYFASRVLLQHGFDAKSLAGGAFINKERKAAPVT